MPDELPPSPADTDGDASKAETIRITLPPKPEQSTSVKRETVRINLPGKPAPTAPPPAAPKKETTKIVVEAEAQTVATATPLPSAPPTSATKPFLPPPPRPPSQAGMPLPPAKPMSGLNPPPKPPSLGTRPTVPLKPAPAPSGVAPKAPLPMGSGIQAAPVTMKAAAPKKETARITLPAEGSGAKPPMPKATVKMQQTQPLVSRPAPALSQSSAMTPAPAITSDGMQSDAAPDGAVNVLAIIALVISLISLALVFLAYQATALS